MIKSDTPSKYGTYDHEVDAREYSEADWYERAVYWKRMFERNNTGQQEKMEFPNAPEPKKYSSFDAHGIKLLMGDFKIVSHFLHEGRTIDAIKHVRTVTGYGLKEAKYYCDELKMKLLADAPSGGVIDMDKYSGPFGSFQ